MTRNRRLTATLDGEFVVFLIGMRVNRPHRADLWAGRTSIMVQYWRSMAQLMEFAKDEDAGHLPAVGS